jgi:peptidoglycan/xylan/chitin deacetylase (PgdA/CDA1 family)
MNPVEADSISGNTIHILATMDAEPVRSEVRSSLRNISVSGPDTWDQSERAISGYAERCARFSLPVTYFLHPEVAQKHAPLLRYLERDGACLGLHLHPYKLSESLTQNRQPYTSDLGAYREDTQREMIGRAAERWAEVIGHHPRYFRGGYFSANDDTFRVLASLGFIGGSLSIPGRILPTHQSVWAGAPDYPHPAHDAFRLCSGSSTFIEVPIAVDYERPVQRGAAGEIGYEWPYLAASYDHAAVARHIAVRIIRDRPGIPVFVIDVHNDQNLDDPSDFTSRNLETIVTVLRETAGTRQYRVSGATIASILNMTGFTA